ncbi:hypothetical protein OM076_15715 [Solirubrobacter ginsenosidimutans]|uniref:Uncharacterized protein n=1 Tax=Solirubrobacter ginsenosidimutans TaxID=490573 RepID=A0A9X3MRN0_9ACTN|nr:hypothetical protein [Solirubrobacter ginsenosidimutans]MDA0161721.1 hypothetical protein [Solirubrobacter ginsenosidimutans]
MRPLTAVLAALAVALTPAATAAAKPVSVAYDESFNAIAYTSGRVLVAEPDPFGAPAIVVREKQLADAGDRVLLEIPYSKGVPDVSLAANATGFLVALRDDAGDRVILGDYDGRQHAVVDCAAPPPADDAPSITVTAGTRGFAFAGARCGPAAVATIGADGTLTPIAGDGPAPRNEELAYAEPYLAIPLQDSVRVIDVTTGAQRRLPPGYVRGDTAVAVLADGTLVMDTSTLDGLPRPGLYTWPASAPTPTFVSARGSGATVRAVGRRIVFEADPPRLIDLDAATSRALGAPGLGLPSLLGFDGRHVALRGFSCSGARQVTVLDLDEPTAPGAAPGCPVRFDQTSLRFDRSGRAHTRVLCANGCRAQVSLVEQSTEQRPCDALDDTGTHPCRTVARARLNLPSTATAHARTLTFALTGTGRRLRRRNAHTLDVRTSFGGNFGLARHGELREVAL